MRVTGERRTLGGVRRSGGGVEQAGAQPGGLDRLGMEWAVALPGGPPPPTPRRGRGPRGSIVIRRNAQPGGLGPVDRRSCRAGGTGRGRGRGAGGILRPAEAETGPACARRTAAGARPVRGRRTWPATPERARRVGTARVDQVRAGARGRHRARESKSESGSEEPARLRRAGGSGRGRCGPNRQGQRARTEEPASR